MNSLIVSDTWEPTVISLITRKKAIMLEKEKHFLISSPKSVQIKLLDNRKWWRAKSGLSSQPKSAGSCPGSGSCSTRFFPSLSVAIDSVLVWATGHVLCSYLPSGKPILPSPLAGVFHSVFFRCSSPSSSKDLSRNLDVYICKSCVVCTAPWFLSPSDPCICFMNF